MRQRRRFERLSILLAMFAAAVGLLARPGVAADAAKVDGKLDPNGRPDRTDDPKGVWSAVWFEGGQWHLRCNGVDDGKPMAFKGRVVVAGGAIIHGDTKGLEKQKKRDPGTDWIEVHPGNKGFDFHFGNRGRTDGLDFKVSERTETITFTILTGGNDNPQRVFVGKRGQHPDAIPFTLAAKPDK